MGEQLQQNTTAFTPKSLSGTSGLRRAFGSAQSPLEQQLSLPAGFGMQMQLQQLLGSSQQQQGFGTGLCGQNNEFSALINSVKGQGHSLSN